MTIPVAVLVPDHYLSLRGVVLTVVVVVWIAAPPRAVSRAWSVPAPPARVLAAVVATVVVAAFVRGRGGASSPTTTRPTPPPPRLGPSGTALP